MGIILVIKLELPELSGGGFDDDDRDRAQAQVSIISMIFNPIVPSQYVAGLTAATVVWGFLVLWGTIISCAWMHRSLWDPQTTFPQIAELCLGRRTAKTVFRFGWGMVAALVFASVVMHKELVIPHLPQLNSVADDVLFWGMVAVGGLVCQAVFLSEVNYSWQTLLHRIGGFCVVLAMYKHMNSTRQLYFPGARTAYDAWYTWLKDYLPDHHLFEDSDAEQRKADRIKSARDFAAASPFLQHHYVNLVSLVRYNVLSYWPWTILMLPVFSSIFERVPENSKVSGSSLLRSMFAWLQWDLCFICSIMLLSYIPDFYVASQLPVPVPTVVEDIVPDAEA